MFEAFPALTTSITTTAQEKSLFSCWCGITWHTFDNTSIINDTMTCVRSLQCYPSSMLIISLLNTMIHYNDSSNKIITFLIIYFCYWLLGYNLDFCSMGGFNHTYKSYFLSSLLLLVQIIFIFVNLWLFGITSHIRYLLYTWSIVELE